MKYIHHEDLGLIIFGNNIGHNVVAEAVGGNIKSAGFVDWDTKTCYGQSDSLQLSCDHLDSVMLNVFSSQRRVA